MFRVSVTPPRQLVRGVCADPETYKKQMLGVLRDTPNMCFVYVLGATGAPSRSCVLCALGVSDGSKTYVSGVRDTPVATGQGSVRRPQNIGKTYVWDATDTPNICFLYVLGAMDTPKTHNTQKSE